MPVEPVSFDQLPAEDTSSVRVTLNPVDVSQDPNAGTIASNGLPIWSPGEGADNLNRYGVNFMEGSYGVADDGVLTYGFWTVEQFMESYFFDLRYSDGEAFIDDAFYAEAYGAFEAFTAAQAAAAAQTIQLWDDLIAVSIQPVAAGETGDIMFGAALMSTSAGAHAFFPQAEAWDAYYGAGGGIGGDVMLNWYYNSPTGDDGGTPIDRPASTSFSNVDPGSYGWFTLAHELGHSFGLAHAGDYNASTTPPPITYDTHAYFFQDSQQYTIMSYFSGRVTGQAAVNWDTGTFVYAQTPAVHDILAVQNVYGADYTTRAGDTVYGFNSTADRSVFDFTVNKVPIVTIWDGGGEDTLDLSGFTGHNIIDLNEGAFSSAGNALTASQKAFWGAYFGLTTDAQFAAFFANNGLGPDGRPVDNIAIAYGAVIENAIGGIGNDRLIGNAVNNKLYGNDGNDMLFGNAGDDKLYGGKGNDVLNGGSGNDQLFGGAGVDTFVFTEGGTEMIMDYQVGEKIDLSALGVTMDDITIKKQFILVDLDGQDLRIMFDTKGFNTADLILGSQSQAQAASNSTASSLYDPAHAGSGMDFMSMPDMSLSSSVHGQHDYFMA